MPCPCIIISEYNQTYHTHTSCYYVSDLLCVKFTAQFTHTVCLTYQFLTLHRCLCLAGCRIDVKNKEGVTPDMTALAQGHGDISDLLKRLKRVKNSKLHIQKKHGLSCKVYLS